MYIYLCKYVRMNIRVTVKVYGYVRCMHMQIRRPLGGVLDTWEVFALNAPCTPPWKPPGPPLDNPWTPLPPY